MATPIILEESRAADAALVAHRCHLGRMILTAAGVGPGPESVHDDAYFGDI